jgi:hypothetical protein
MPDPFFIRTMIQSFVPSSAGWIDAHFFLS